MKKAKSQEEDDVRSEYSRSDFGKMVRGKYAARIAKESNIIVLDEDVAKSFPNDLAVNDALRLLLDIAEKSRKITKPSSRREKTPQN
jgi:hypothetical protein